MLVLCERCKQTSNQPSVCIPPCSTALLQDSYALHVCGAFQFSGPPVNIVSGGLSLSGRTVHLPSQPSGHLLVIQPGWYVMVCLPTRTPVLGSHALLTMHVKLTFSMVAVRLQCSVRSVRISCVDLEPAEAFWLPPAAAFLAHKACFAPV